MSSNAYVNLVAPDGTTPKAALGQTFETKGAVWRYILAKGALAAYEWAIGIATNTGEFAQGSYSGTYPALNVVSDVVIPQFAFADGEYGWAPCGPFFLREDDTSNFKVSALTLAVLNTVLYTSGTAGSVDDSSSSQVQISGLTLLSTVGGSTAATACKATRRLGVNC